MSNSYIELLEAGALNGYKKHQIELYKISRCKEMVKNDNLSNSETSYLREKFESMAKQMKSA